MDEKLFDELKGKVVAANKASEWERVPVLLSCLNSDTIGTRDKADCAYQLFLIHALKDINMRINDEVLKYVHIAYELVPTNTTYREDFCLSTSYFIMQYQLQEHISQLDAPILLKWLKLWDRFSLVGHASCFQNMLSRTTPKEDDSLSNTVDYMIAQAANALGLFLNSNTNGGRESLENAKFCFQLAYYLNPYQKVTHAGNLAAIHYKLGDFTSAIPLYQECLKTAVNDMGFSRSDKANCASTLALIYLGNKQFAKSYVYAEQAHRLDADESYYVYNVALSSYATHRYEQAADYFAQCCYQGKISDIFTLQVQEAACSALNAIQHNLEL